MDVVILAGGQGERLRGIAPPFYKPLTIVNGMPLILHHLRSVHDLAASRVIVVTAPDNTKPICDLLGSSLYSFNKDRRVVVQMERRGPGEALLLGLEVCLSETVYVVCADNLVPDEDVSKFFTECLHSSVMIYGRAKIAAASQARRFTVISPKHGVAEKVTDEAALEDMRGVSGEFDVWLGPLRVPRAAALSELRVISHSIRPSAEIPLSGLLARFHEAKNLQPLDVNCVDIGVPEAWQ